MKLSVSLSERDVETLDHYAEAHGLPSRSAAMQRAIRALQHEALIEDYATAFGEWEQSEDAALWDRTTSDGIDDAAW